MLADSKERATTGNAGFEFESGSYRDRSSRVVCSGDEIFRVLNAESLEMWKALSDATFFVKSVARGEIVETTDVGEVDPALGAADAQWRGVVRHERIPVISYPYEWTFSMLKDAGLLHLRLLREALADDFITKDGTSYNIQFQGTQPVFIDIGSFERYAPGSVWSGYRQFCQTFLFPLLLQAYRGIPFQSWLRGSLDGIEVSAIRRLFSVWEFWKPGIPFDVLMQARLQRPRPAEIRGQSPSEITQVSRAGFTKSMLVNNLQRLERILKKLRCPTDPSIWVNYATQNSYADEDATLKESLVRRVSEQRRRRVVWDLGCNTGRFSRIAAEHAETVLAVDGDLPALEKLYLALKQEKISNIQPLYSNLADPSPSQGWRGCERKSLAERSRPDLILCLALLHHLVIGANLPMEEVLTWLSSLGKEVILEYVARDDAMVQGLLRNKPDVYWDYNEDQFLRLVQERFQIREAVKLTSGTRTLYALESRQTS